MHFLVILTDPCGDDSTTPSVPFSSVHNMDLSCNTNVHSHHTSTHETQLGEHTTERLVAKNSRKRHLTSGSSDCSRSSSGGECSGPNSVDEFGHRSQEDCEFLSGEEKMIPQEDPKNRIHSGSMNMVNGDSGERREQDNGSSSNHNNNNNNNNNNHHPHWKRSGSSSTTSSNGNSVTNVATAPANNHSRVAKSLFSIRDLVKLDNHHSNQPYHHNNHHHLHSRHHSGKLIIF